MRCRSLVILAACGVLLAAVPLPGQGAGDESLRAQLEARIAAVQKDARTRERAIAEGREHAVLCTYCHGPDGNSTKPDIPNLASQNPVYLLEQIERFASGRRVDYTRVMQQLTRRMTPQETLALVVYYASVPLNPARADIAQAQQGLPLYQRVCQGCHGKDGNGVAGYARIAGQQPQYVTATLKAYRDRTPGRLSPEMDAVTRGLSDADISALAAYVANLR